MIKQNSIPQVQLSTLFLTGDSKPLAQLAVWGKDYLTLLNKEREKGFRSLTVLPTAMTIVCVRQTNDYEASEG
jgi:hypothetical protein